ncbi:glycosyltransferase family 4 protein [Mesorhizobium sp. M0913]
MVNAYEQYRSQIPDPWPLICCGQGEFARQIAASEFIRDLGFVQPSDMHRIWLGAGVFVIPSRYDPWPLALVEACAAGLPVIASQACGSAVECVRDRSNGLLIAKDNVDDLCRAMVESHTAFDRLPRMGVVSRALAEPYSAEAWSYRWSHILQRSIANQRLT